MDLDNIKKSWQSNEPKLNIDKDKIQQMLDNKRKGAFNKLLKYEILGFILSLALIPFTFLFKEKEPSIWFYLLCSIIVIILWQIYKCYFLKKTDLGQMGLFEISLRINKYRKYIMKEFIVASVWSLIFTFIFCFFVIHRNFIAKHGESTLDEIWIILIFCGWTLILTPLVAWSFYKKLFIKNIKKIEESIDEAKEYERDNLE